MMTTGLIFLIASLSGQVCRLASAGAGERDFLGKRPGLRKDMQLWNDFLRSENQADSTGVGDILKLDSEMPDEDHGKSSSHTVLLDSSTRKRPGRAATSTPRRKASDKTTRKMTPAVLLEVNASGVCHKEVKQCKKDAKNCNHVLDILQFLRLEHIAVEKVMRQEGELSLRQGGALLQTVLEKHGFATPNADDWSWTGKKEKFFLQTSLEEHAHALTDKEWKSDESNRSPPLYHPIPQVGKVKTSHHHHTEHKVPTQRGEDEPFTGPLLPAATKALHLEVHHAHCPVDIQKELDECNARLKTCKTDADNLNVLLNSVAEKASAWRQQRLTKLQGPPGPPLSSKTPWHDAQL